ncbi:MAG: type II methionyl aminopeptidase [Nanoarchaeota archaeon]|nr:type II methionyl aminopeptidase [Nanoarchaeota archaeon]MBU1988603.1 type II methionyl aminopeptidase [Nanoarchaeota archaeon]
MEKEQIEKLKKAGDIAKKVKVFAREIICKDIPLLEIAEKIDAKILELGGKPAFPINLSINEIAAHSTPSHNDDQKAHGLLKIDIGVHIDGFVADTAFSLDLENNEENKQLIEAAESALESGIKATDYHTELREIGKAIENTIKSRGFQPIINLSGHSIDQYDLHSGITIPNYDNLKEYNLEEGVYAIEPFSTSGHGKVRDGKPSGIYHLEPGSGQVRDPFAREVLNYIKEKYQTLPFCSRWLVKKLSTRALIALKRLEEANIIHQYLQLVEINRKPVAQAEHTLVLTKNEKIVTT